jgi:energy-coupling factor transporter ATP-binding protein EcfA2
MKLLPVIALTGSDGSGKSTLAAALVAQLSAQLPTEQLYLGQSSGKIGDWIGTLPVIGPRFKRYLVSKSDKVHDQPAKPPGNATALVIYLLSRWRAYKFRRLLAMCRRGTLVVTDRYPQAERPGFSIDGPQLAKTQGGNWWVRHLRARENKLYAWMATSVPMLVIRLNVDVETAHARKPDHKLSSLREKIAAIPHLHFNGAAILDLDGTDSASSVLDSSMRAIHSALQVARA